MKSLRSPRKRGMATVHEKKMNVLPSDRPRIAASIAARYGSEPDFGDERARNCPLSYDRDRPSMCRHVGDRQNKLIVRPESDVAEARRRATREGVLHDDCAPPHPLSQHQSPATPRLSNGMKNPRCWRVVSNFTGIVDVEPEFPAQAESDDGRHDDRPLQLERSGHLHDHLRRGVERQQSVHILSVPSTRMSLMMLMINSEVVAIMMPCR